MSGALLQIVAKGAPDMLLTQNPEFSFHRIKYKHYADFACEEIEQTFSGVPDFNKRVVCTISRNADLLRSLTLNVTLPAQDLSAATGGARFRWLNYPGFRLLKKFEVEIGGQLIDRQYGEWLYIWYQLSCPPGSRRNMEEMVGNTHDLVLMKDANGVPLDATCSASELTNTCVARAGTPSKTLQIPLSTLWFAKNPGLAVPLIALAYHELKVNLEFHSFAECCYWDGTGYTPTAQSFVACSLYANYVYLETDERRSVSQKTHTFLIEQLQFPGAETITSTSYKSRMNFSHPTKAIYWVVQRDSFVNCTTTPSSVQWIADAGGAQPFNFTDDWMTDGLIHDVLGRPELATTTGSMASFLSGGASWVVPEFGESTGANLARNSELSADGSGVDGSGHFISGTTNYLLAKLLLESGVKCQGKNPVEVAKIQLNGKDRFAERDGSYFDVKQVLESHTGAGARGINMYNFGYRPEDWQPSGTLNFSRIDTATLHLTLSVNTVRDSRTAQLRIYAVNYNQLNIVSGMGGLSYAS